MDQAIDAAIAARTTPGVAVRITRGSQVLYARYLGKANLETNTPVSPDSVFRIGSVSKQFTAAAVLLLQQEGKLALDDPFGRFIPDFPGGDRITIRQLLNHTSGFGNFTHVKDLRTFLQNSRLDYDEAALLKVLRDTDPLFLFEPGTGWSYSNNDYVMLGIIVGRVSGQSYAAYLRKRLFEPLGLHGTAVDDAAEVVAQRASGYSPNLSAPSGFENASFTSMTYPGGAGAIRSTAADLCRWTAALHAGQVVDKDNLAAMMSPARLKDGSLPPPPPGSPAGADGPRYGFGVSVDRPRGHSRVWHLGGIQGFYADLRAYPELGLQVAVLVNSDGVAGATPSAAIAGAITKVILA